MKHEPTGLPGDLAGFSIDRISDQRRTFMMEMNPDLMSAAGMKVAKNQRSESSSVGGEYFIVSDGSLSTRWINNCHLLAVHRVTTNVGEDRVLGRLWDTLTHGEIEFLHRPPRELSDERLMSTIRLGDHDAS